MLYGFKIVISNLCYSLQQAGVPAEVLGTLQAQQWAGAYPNANVAPRAPQAANPAAPIDLNAQNNAPAQPASE